MLRPNKRITKPTLEKGGIVERVSHYLQEKCCPNVFNIADEILTSKKMQMIGRMICEEWAPNTMILENCNIQAKELKVLGEYLSYNRTITKLYLVKNNIDDRAMYAMSLGIVKNRSIKLIDLSKNNMSYEGIRELGKSLSVNSSIEEVYLGQINKTITRNQTYIDISCLQMIRYTAHEDFFFVTASLQVEKMVRQYLDATDIPNIIKLLELVPEITMLDLSSSKLLPSEIKVLSTVLATNNTIKVLNLSNNKINNEGLNMLEKALLDNKSLKCLRLEDNMISYDGLGALQNILDNNKVLEYIGLQNNQGDCYINDARLSTFNITSKIDQKDSNIATVNDQEIQDGSINNNSSNKEQVIWLSSESKEKIDKDGITMQNVDIENTLGIGNDKKGKDDNILSNCTEVLKTSEGVCNKLCVS